jgi:hypothetical protein
VYFFFLPEFSDILEYKHVRIGYQYCTMILIIISFRSLVLCILNCIIIPWFQDSPGRHLRRRISPLALEVPKPSNARTPDGPGLFLLRFYSGTKVTSN